MANATFIKNIKIKGYKSIQELEIDFQPGLNIIIGKNGSGKTNFVEFLFRITNFKVADLSYFDCVLNGFHNQVKDFVLWIKSQSFYENNQSNTNLFGELTSDSKIFTAQRRQNYSNPYFSELSNEINKEYPFLLESKIIPFNISQKIDFITQPETILIGFSGSTIFPYVPKYYETSILEMFKTGGLNELFNGLINPKNVPNFDSLPFGDNNELIERLLTSTDGFFSELKKYLMLYSPIKNIRFSPDLKIKKLNNDLIFSNLIIEFYVNNHWQVYDLLSDGTKRLFYIIEEIFFYQNIIILEEPEIGIHPHQLHLLMLFLKEEAERKQIFITTHSPQILDVLNPGELNKIIICEMTENGTQLHHLSEKQKSKAKKYMKDEAFLSDYWIHSDLEPQIL